jgi:hypothetical protein
MRARFASMSAKLHVCPKKDYLLTKLRSLSKYQQEHRTHDLTDMKLPTSGRLPGKEYCVSKLRRK